MKQEVPIKTQRPENKNGLHQMKDPVSSAPEIGVPDDNNQRMESDNREVYVNTLPTSPPIPFVNVNKQFTLDTTCRRVDIPVKAKQMPKRAPISELLLAKELIIGDTKPASSPDIYVRSIEVSGVKYVHAPEKKPYITEKIIVPTTSLMASGQNTRIAVIVVHIITMLKTPTRLTSRFGKIRPKTLAPLRIAIWVFHKIVTEKQPSKDALCRRQG